MIRQKNRKLPSLLLSLLFLTLLAYMIIAFPPSHQFIVFGFEVPILSLFFVSIFLFFFSLGTTIFSNKKNGLLVGLFIISYLLFRLNNLTHIIFVILLIGFFITLGLLFTYRR